MHPEGVPVTYLGKVGDKKANFCTAPETHKMLPHNHNRMSVHSKLTVEQINTKVYTKDSENHRR